MNTKQPFHAWICPRCGQKNTKAFCGNCGLSRENASHISTLGQNKIKAGNIVKNIRIPTISNPAEKIENFNANHERGIRRCLLAVIIVLSMVLIGLVLYRLPVTRAIVRSWLPQTNTVISAEMKQEQEKQVENVKKQEETAKKAEEKKQEDAEREKQKKEGQDAPKKKFEEFHKYIQTMPCKKRISVCHRIFAVHWHMMIGLLGLTILFPVRLLIFASFQPMKTKSSFLMI